ncbi:hypothetical protein TCAL_12627 [Tigriopus californicus]|uniref:Kinesin-like protein n=1 Tax=Tigriopus californicus TaxID=6832 RepID=A0A553NWY0_TIGCA|nr:carboxy-terminal kinesin 2-like [Tigriopus californicus]TRY69930.1 hypothetical protein TCAL_12627 [Tigriopus californicus]|eukprot:TCALIF_12627-PA protein Name:"Similar to Carboxy-terminal kinesin 2 (Xenopus laevis)" AED:0.06 eAED:0.06 QI:119/1/1/1/1/1/6/141/676
MSGIPRPGSRLPQSSSSVKRPRAGSNDENAGQPGLLAKKKKMDPPTLPLKKTSTSNLSKAKSMMNIGPKSKVTQPLGTSNMSGRATNVLGRRPGANPVGGNTSNLAPRTRATVTTNAPVGPGPGPKKRPAWDLKGRLEDMEGLFASTAERVSTLESQNTQLKTVAQEKETEVIQNSEELKSVAEERDSLRKQIETLKKELSEVTDLKECQAKNYRTQLDDLEFKKSALERKLKGLEDELNARIAEIGSLKSIVAQSNATKDCLEATLENTKRHLASAEDKLTELEKLASQQAAQIDQHRENERAFETERRRLHNTIQELKGNIRVFCRVRPLLKGEVEKVGPNIRHIEFVSENSLELKRIADSPNESIASGIKGKNSKYDFEFDRVFGPNAKQAQVFEEICQLVQSAIDGYNVCVFAYGQTGSGKTFTMEGGEEPGNEGMIPLTLDMIYQETKKLEGKGWTYKMEASFLEIYNEEIRDLLATEKNLKYDIKLTSSDVKGQTNDVYVSNVKVVEVKSPHQVTSLLSLAHKNRAIAATNCNERSSRSHSVFQLKITGSNSITTESCSGTLNLVDLAGSERLKDSGSEGLRLKETQNINKSLANLGNVIMALAQKDSHIPYRNSKLTHLLQNSLGGNSKTLMFVNVSPKEDSFSETLNSLRFATKVNQCQIGTATKKIK